MNATVRWYEEDKDGNKTLIKSIDTTGNCIHIQSFNTNALFVHCVVTFAGVPDTNEPRLVFSFRQSISPEGKDYNVFQTQLQANHKMSLDRVHNNYSCFRVLSSIKKRISPQPADFQELVEQHPSFCRARDIPGQANNDGGLTCPLIPPVTLRTDRWKAAIKPEDQPPQPLGLVEDEDPIWQKCLKEPYQLILRKLKIEVLILCYV